MRRWTPIVALLALLGLSAPAPAVYPPAPKDDGKVFSKEGIEKANKKIREIYEKYKRDVVVETIATLSADQEKKMKEDGEAKFFAKLSTERGKEIGLDGVYILVCKKPKYLRVHMDPATQKTAFTATNRKAAFDKIVAKFKEDEFDAGLLDGLNEIETVFAAHAKGTTKGDKR